MAEKKSEGAAEIVQKSEGLWDTAKTVFYAVLIALCIRTMAFEPFNIPSGSMIPTLLVGDYLFVSKFSYGYSRHSLPLSPKIFSGRVLFTAPVRGDVAVFKLPSDNETDYIKRLVGLPGDTIQMKAGRLYINNTILPRKRVKDFVLRDERGNFKAVAQYVETLPNGRDHRILEMLGDDGPLDNTPLYTVPAGHYFAMGDNRDNSSDSRVPNIRGMNGVGFVPMENLVGRAEVMFFSTDGSAALWEVWGWFPAMRFSRFFSVIN
jgi:signal peptidase I